eukprot:m.24256 g.24256  ORF g.24256 m.24256 type:complete len:520 (+) comp5636_c0_seq1:2598-4157(+)
MVPSAGKSSLLLLLLLLLLPFALSSFSSSSSSSSSTTTTTGSGGDDTEGGGGDEGEVGDLVKSSAKSIRVMLHQVIIVLIPIYIIVSLNKFYPLPALFFSKLQRSVPPPAQELIKLSSSKLERELSGDVRDFEIPVDSRIVAEKKEIEGDDIFKLSYISSFSEVLIISCSSITGVVGFAVYALATGTSMDFNSAAFYLSILAIFDCLKVLYTLVFVGGKANGLMSLSFMFIWFIAVLALWIPGAKYISLDVEEAYKQTEIAVKQVLQETAPISSSSPQIEFPEFRFMKLLLSLVCGAIATSLLFPTMRIARSHVAALVVHRESTIKMLLLHLSFFSPVLIALLFIVPTETAIVHYIKPLLPECMQKETRLFLRVVATVVVVLLRIGMFKNHMQAYLDVAQEKLSQIDEVKNSVEEKKEASKSKKKSKQPKTKMISAGLVQKLVSNIWDYAGVVSLQLLVPNILFLFSAFLMMLRRSDSDVLSPWGELGAGLLWSVTSITLVVEVLGMLMWQHMNKSASY